MTRGFFSLKSINTGAKNDFQFAILFSEKGNCTVHKFDNCTHNNCPNAQKSDTKFNNRLLLNTVQQLFSSYLRLPTSLTAQRRRTNGRGNAIRLWILDSTSQRCCNSQCFDTFISVNTTDSNSFFFLGGGAGEENKPWNTSPLFLTML